MQHSFCLEYTDQPSWSNIPETYKYTSKKYNFLFCFSFSINMCRVESSDGRVADTLLKNVISNHLLAKSTPSLVCQNSQIKVLCHLPCDPSFKFASKFKHNIIIKELSHSFAIIVHSKPPYSELPAYLDISCPCRSIRVIIPPTGVPWSCGTKCSWGVTWMHLETSSIWSWVDTRVIAPSCAKCCTIKCCRICWVVGSCEIEPTNPCTCAGAKRTWKIKIN